MFTAFINIDMNIIDILVKIIPAYKLFMRQTIEIGDINAQVFKI